MRQRDEFIIARATALTTAVKTGICQVVWQLQDGNLVVRDNTEPAPQELHALVLRVWPNGEITYA